MKKLKSKPKKPKKGFTVQSPDKVGDKIKSSMTYSRIFNVLRMIDKGINLDALQQEIEHLHASRTMRQLGIKHGISVKRTIKANQRDQSYRSRIVEIWAQIIKPYNLLVHIHENGIAYFMSEYEADIPGRSRDAKWNYVNKYFSRVKRKIVELETVVEIADAILKDIDAASWVARNTLQGMVVATKSEVQL